MRIIGIKFLSSEVLAQSVSPKYKTGNQNFQRKAQDCNYFLPKQKLRGLLFSFLLDLINYGLFT